MSYSVKIKASLPKDRDLNGVAAIREKLLKSPMTEHVAIVVLDCARITEDVEDMIRTPTARIMRIEPETDPDRAAELLARARELADERNPKPKPLIDPDEAAGRHTGVLRLAGQDR